MNIPNIFRQTQIVFRTMKRLQDFLARHVWKNRRVFHRKWPVYEECHLTCLRRLLMILRLIFLAIEICHSCDVNMHPEPFGSIEFPLAWVQHCTMVLPTQQMNFGKRNHGFLDCALGNSFVFLWPVFRVPIIRLWYVIHRFLRKTWTCHLETYLCTWWGVLDLPHYFLILFVEKGSSLCSSRNTP